MSALWLLVRSPGGSFDVRVDDTNKTNLMELIEYMFEDSMKQNVYLPKCFTLLVCKPGTNCKVELVRLVDDGAMLKMWEWYEGQSEIEVFIEETEIAPPLGKRNVGRPPKQRRRATHEAKKERGTRSTSAAYAKNLATMQRHARRKRRQRIQQNNKLPLHSQTKQGGRRERLLISIG
ncbi:unnamed protein product [Amaranthus hypochondriacus]